MDTPSKKPKRYSMTHEEEEEMQHDISKLQDQVQQISFSQRVTKNELEANMDCLKSDMEEIMNVNMEGLKDGFKIDLKRDLEGLKEILTKLL